jgi:hypothetical protein
MKEIRTILFTPDELKCAVDEFLRRGGTHFPPGSIKAVEIAGDPPTATLSVPSTQGGTRPFVVTTKQLLSAAIEFCVESRIRLPKRSTKRIEAVGNSIALIITMADSRSSSEVPIALHGQLAYADGSWAIR